MADQRPCQGHTALPAARQFSQLAFRGQGHFRQDGLDLGIDLPATGCLYPVLQSFQFPQAGPIQRLIR